MTARAHDVAQRHLSIEPFGRYGGVRQPTDLSVLHAQMIELEHDGVRLAAVHAGVRQEVLQYVGLRALTTMSESLP